MKNIANVIVAIVVVWLIVSYLIPLLPSPFSTVAMVLVVLGCIFWLMRLANMDF